MVSTLPEVVVQRTLRGMKQARKQVQRGAKMVRYFAGRARSAEKSLYFHLRDTRAGQVLLSFDCSLQQAQLDRARATLGAADKQLATQRRLVELNATGRMEIDQAEAEVAKTRAEMAQIQVQLGKCQVLAPFSGRVAEQRVREQQFVQAGQPLLEVLDDSVLEVEFIMPSRWLQSVRVGSTVHVAVDETGKTYAAKVQRLGARVDPVSQSVKVVAAIEGRHDDLIAGMSGKVLVARQP